MRAETETESTSATAVGAAAAMAGGVHATFALVTARRVQRPGVRVVFDHGDEQASWARECEVVVAEAFRRLREETGELEQAAVEIRTTRVGDLAPLAAAWKASGGLLHQQLAGKRVCYLGELALGGRVRSVRGVAPIVRAATPENVDLLVIPDGNAIEARLAGPRVPVVVVSSALDLTQRGNPQPLEDAPTHPSRPSPLDMGDVRGCGRARRALEVAAAGGHSILLVGRPGTGKTLLARRLTTIVPALRDADQRDATDVHSIAGLLSQEHPHVSSPPFRAPHHTVSEAGLVGMPGRPGEVSLATGGVLLLDEWPAFRMSCRESVINATRRGRTLAGFPARPLVIASANPCPCGYSGMPGVPRCSCTPEKIQAYRGRWCLPHETRPPFDLIVDLEEIPAVTPQWGPRTPSEASEAIRARVERAREILPPPAPVERPVNVMDRLQRVANTIAALDGCSSPREADYREANDLVQIGWVSTCL